MLWRCRPHRRIRCHPALHVYAVVLLPRHRLSAPHCRGFTAPEPIYNPTVTLFVSCIHINCGAADDRQLADVRTAAEMNKQYRLSLSINEVDDFQ